MLFKKEFDFSGFIRGIVVTTEDPLMEGRIGVFIPELITEEEYKNGQQVTAREAVEQCNKVWTNEFTHAKQIKRINYIWARQSMLLEYSSDNKITGGNLRVPDVNTHVYVFFEHGDPAKCYWLPYGPSLVSDKLPMKNVGTNDDTKELAKLKNDPAMRPRFDVTEYTNGNTIYSFNNDDIEIHELMFAKSRITIGKTKQVQGVFFNSAGGGIIRINDHKDNIEIASQTKAVTMVFDDKKKDYHLTVQNDANENIKHDKITKIANNSSIEIKNNSTIVIAGNESRKVSRNSLLEIAGNLKQKITGKVEKLFESTFSLLVKAEVDIKVDSSASIAITNDLDLSAKKIVEKADNIDTTIGSCTETYKAQKTKVESKSITATQYTLTATDYKVESKNSEVKTTKKTEAIDTILESAVKLERKFDDGKFVSKTKLSSTFMSLGNMSFSAPNINLGSANITFGPAPSTISTASAHSTFAFKDTSIGMTTDDLTFQDADGTFKICGSRRSLKFSTEEGKTEFFAGQFLCSTDNFRLTPANAATTNIYHDGTHLTIDYSKTAGKGMTVKTDTFLHQTKKGVLDAATGEFTALVRNLIITTSYGTVTMGADDNTLKIIHTDKTKVLISKSGIETSYRSNNGTKLIRQGPDGIFIGDSNIPNLLLSIDELHKMMHNNDIEIYNKFRTVNEHLYSLFELILKDLVIIAGDCKKLGGLYLTPNPAIKTKMGEIELETNSTNFPFTDKDKIVDRITGFYQGYRN